MRNRFRKTSDIITALVLAALVIGLIVLFMFNHVKRIDYVKNDDNTYTISKAYGSYISFEVPSTHNDLPVISIGAKAFIDQKKLKSLTFSSSSNIETISKDAFKNCTSLQEIKFPDSLKTIDYFAFRNCTSLKTITFSEKSKLESIGGSAFYECTEIKTLDLSNISNEISIGSYSFALCSTLEEVYLPKTDCIIYNDVFYDSKNLKVIYTDVNTALPADFISKYGSLITFN